MSENLAEGSENMPPKSDESSGRIVEMFPQKLVAKTDEEGQGAWSVSHRTIGACRSNRMKISNILTKRMKVENERFKMEEDMDSDDMEGLTEVIGKGVKYIEQNSMKVRETI